MRVQTWSSGCENLSACCLKQKFVLNFHLEVFALLTDIKVIRFWRFPPLSDHSHKNCALNSCPLLSISKREIFLACFVFIFTVKVDGPYLVTFCCLLPYITRIHKDEIFLLPQMYLKKPGSVPESFGANFQLLWIIKVHSQRAIRKPHRSPPSVLTIFEHMVHSLLLKRHMMSFWCLFLNFHLTHPLLKYRSMIKKSNRIRPDFLKFTILSCRSWDTHVTRSSCGNVQNWSQALCPCRWPTIWWLASGYRCVDPHARWIISCLPYRLMFIMLSL